MIEEIKVGQKEILFARHNGKLIYPKYASAENLVLHYDFSGRTNLDVQKGIAEDLSGNGNNGVLQNFAYIDESGYLDNALIFDGIDDFITIPEPQIDLDNFTYSEGINVLSFRGDEVATVVDGVVEIGGRNLILHSLIHRGTYGDDNRGRWYNNSGGVYDVTKRGVFKENTQYTLWYERGDIDSGRIRPLVYYTDGSNSRGIWASDIPFITPKNKTVDYVRFTYGSEGRLEIINPTFVEGNKPLKSWTPAPEDLEKTTFKPLFGKKIKSALYWNRALTDEELLQVYNIQIKRI